MTDFTLEDLDAIIAARANSADDNATLTSWRAPRNLCFTLHYARGCVPRAVMPSVMAVATACQKRAEFHARRRAAAHSRDPLHVAARVISLDWAARLSSERQSERVAAKRWAWAIIVVAAALTVASACCAVSYRWR